MPKKIEFKKEATSEVGHGLDMRVDGERWDVCFDICQLLCKNGVTVGLGKRTFLVVDEFVGGDPVEVIADTPLEAAEETSATGEHTCPKPFHVTEIQEGVWRVIDDRTKKGWGKGCKYENDPPKHQEICLVIETAPRN